MDSVINVLLEVPTIKFSSYQKSLQFLHGGCKQTDNTNMKI